MKINIRISEFDFITVKNFYFFLGEKGDSMRKDLLLIGVILLLTGLVISFMPIQLTPSNSIANNYWLGFPLLICGAVIMQLSLIFKKDSETSS